MVRKKLWLVIGSQEWGTMIFNLSFYCFKNAYDVLPAYGYVKHICNWCPYRLSDTLEL